MTKKIFIRIFTFSTFAVIVTAILTIAVCSISVNGRYEGVAVETLIQSLIPYIIAVIFGVLILSIAVSYAMAKSIISSIEKLGSNLENPDKIKTYKELTPFLENIKQQNEKRKQLDKEKKQFTANASHELKTPLTAIAGYAELIESGIAKEDDIKPFAHTIRKQALRLVTLAEDIIKLSQIEEDDAPFAMEEVDLLETAKSAVETVKPIASARNIDVTIDGTSTYIPANRTLADELLFNLIDNAVRYNKDGGQVTVTLFSDEHTATLIVKDTGIGIPKKYSDRVFERFFRVDKSRSKETGGTGLGLAIVKHIADVHGAEISVDSVENEGTTFTVIFNK